MTAKCLRREGIIIEWATSPATFRQILRQDEMIPAALWACPSRWPPFWSRCLRSLLLHFAVLEVSQFEAAFLYSVVTAVYRVVPQQHQPVCVMADLEETHGSRLSHVDVMCAVQTRLTLRLSLFVQVSLELHCSVVGKEASHHSSAVLLRGRIEAGPVIYRAIHGAVQMTITLLEWLTIVLCRSHSWPSDFMC